MALMSAHLRECLRNRREKILISSEPISHTVPSIALPTWTGTQPNIAQGLSLSWIVRGLGESSLEPSSATSAETPMEALISCRSSCRRFLARKILSA